MSSLLPVAMAAVGIFLVACACLALWARRELRRERAAEEDWLTPLTIVHNDPLPTYKKAKGRRPWVKVIETDNLNVACGNEPRHRKKRTLRPLTSRTLGLLTIILPAAARAERRTEWANELAAIRDGIEIPEFRAPRAMRAVLLARTPQAIRVPRWLASTCFVVCLFRGVVVEGLDLGRRRRRLTSASEDGLHPRRL